MAYLKNLGTCKVEGCKKPAVHELIDDHGLIVGRFCRADARRELAKAMQPFLSKPVNGWGLVTKDRGDCQVFCYSRAEARARRASYPIGPMRIVRVRRVEWRGQRMQFLGKDRRLHDARGWRDLRGVEIFLVGEGKKQLMVQLQEVNPVEGWTLKGAFHAGVIVPFGW